MSTTHVYFADMPLAAAGKEGHSSLDVLDDDAIRQCRSISPNCNSNSPLPRYERNMGFFRQLSRRFGLRSNDDLVFSNSNEDDTQSSSTDSCSSAAVTSTTSAAVSNAGDNNKKDNNQRLSSATASEYISCASSESSSTVDIEEQLQQLQQHQQQQQPQQHRSNNENVTIHNDDFNDNVDADADNNENADNDVTKHGFNKERKSFARSSFSRLHRRSTTSLRRAFEAFSLSSRSLSCSGATPSPTLPTSSLSNTTTHNGTPIKSALKSCSNLELNKQPTSCLKKSCCSSYSFSSASSAAKSTSSSSLTFSSSSSKTKSKPPPQRILRQPVSYTYLKGISGLPTQRVPRNSVCCQYARR